MTWEPRNKTGDDLDDVSVDEYEDKDEDDQKESGNAERNGSIEIDKDEDSNSGKDTPSTNKKISSEQCSDKSFRDDENKTSRLSVTDLQEKQKSEDNIATAEKPKIWSLARTATSESPPSSRKHPLESPSSEDLKRMRRMHPLYVESFNRNIPRLHHDSSAESSLSSPPAWRTADLHSLNHGDKYGRITPLDSSDVVSVSPSSSGSPAIVTSSTELSSTPSPSMAYGRFLGCRLFSCSDGSPSGLRPPTDHSQYYSTQASSIPHSLDLRTCHPSFLQTLPFGHPSGFSVPPIPHPSMQSPPATSVKGKPENGDHSQSDS